MFKQKSNFAKAIAHRYLFDDLDHKFYIFKPLNQSLPTYSYSRSDYSEQAAFEKFEENFSKDERDRERMEQQLQLIKNELAELQTSYHEAQLSREDFLVRYEALLEQKAALSSLRTNADALHDKAERIARRIDFWRDAPTEPQQLEKIRDLVTRENARFQKKIDDEKAEELSFTPFGGRM